MLTYILTDLASNIVGSKHADNSYDVQTLLCLLKNFSYNCSSSTLDGGRKARSQVSEGQNSRAITHHISVFDLILLQFTLGDYLCICLHHPYFLFLLFAVVVFSLLCCLGVSCTVVFFFLIFNISSLFLVFKIIGISPITQSNSNTEESYI